MLAMIQGWRCCSPGKTLLRLRKWEREPVVLLLKKSWKLGSANTNILSRKKFRNGEKERWIADEIAFAELKASR